MGKKGASAKATPPPRRCVFQGCGQPVQASRGPAVCDVCKVAKAEQRLQKRREQRASGDAEALRRRKEDAERKSKARAEEATPEKRSRLDAQADRTAKARERETSPQKRARVERQADAQAKARDRETSPQKRVRVERQADAQAKARDRETSPQQRVRVERQADAQAKARDRETSPQKRARLERQADAQAKAREAADTPTREVAKQSDAKRHAKARTLTTEQAYVDAYMRKHAPKRTIVRMEDLRVTGRTATTIMVKDTRTGLSLPIDCPPPCWNHGKLRKPIPLVQLDYKSVFSTWFSSAGVSVERKEGKAPDEGSVFDSNSYNVFELPYNLCHIANQWMFRPHGSSDYRAIKEFVGKPGLRGDLMMRTSVYSIGSDGTKRILADVLAKSSTKEWKPQPGARTSRFAAMFYKLNSVRPRLVISEPRAERFGGVQRRVRDLTVFTGDHVMKTEVVDASYLWRVDDGGLVDGRSGYKSVDHESGLWPCESFGLPPYERNFQYEFRPVDHGFKEEADHVFFENMGDYVAPTSVQSASTISQNRSISMGQDQRLDTSDVSLAKFVLSVRARDCF